MQKIPNYDLGSFTTVVLDTSVLLRPDISAMIMITKTAPPNIHIHGCISNFVVVVVTVLLELLVDSWACVTRLIKLNTIKSRNCVAA